MAAGTDLSGGLEPVAVAVWPPSEAPPAFQVGAGVAAAPGTGLGWWGGRRSGPARLSEPVSWSVPSASLPRPSQGALRGEGWELRPPPPPSRSSGIIMCLFVAVHFSYLYMRFSVDLWRLVDFNRPVKVSPFRRNKVPVLQGVSIGCRLKVDWESKADRLGGRFLLHSRLEWFTRRGMI